MEVSVKEEGGGGDLAKPKKVEVFTDSKKSGKKCHKRHITLYYIIIYYY